MVGGLAKQVSAQGESIEFTHGRMDDLTKDLKGFKEEVYSRVKGVITSHNKLVDTVKRWDDLIKEMKVKIMVLEAKNTSTEKFLKEGGMARKDFHTDYTVVVENLLYLTPEGEEEMDEDLQSDAKYIFGKCMGVDIKVVWVKRMSIRWDNTGQVKFELANEQMVKDVIKKEAQVKGCKQQSGDTRPVGQKVKNNGEAH